MPATASEIRALTASAFTAPAKFRDFCRNGSAPLGGIIDGEPSAGSMNATEAALRDRDLPGLHHIIEAKYHIDGDAAFATKHLVPLLDTTEGRNCGGANRVIAGMGADAKDALPALIAAMQKYKEWEVCYDLMTLAPHFRDQAVTALREALDDPNLAASASHALRQIGAADVEVDVAELVKDAQGGHPWLPTSPVASPKRRRSGRCGPCNGRSPCASPRWCRSSPRRGPR